MDKKVEKELDEMIDSELEKCTPDVYPTLCRLKSSEVGIGKIRKMVRAVIDETPMDIGSALAQIDSSY